MTTPPTTPGWNIIRDFSRPLPMDAECKLKDHLKDPWEPSGFRGEYAPLSDREILHYRTRDASYAQEAGEVPESFKQAIKDAEEGRVVDMDLAIGKAFEIYSFEELQAIDELCKSQDLKPEQVLKQALRHYQMKVKGEPEMPVATPASQPEGEGVGHELKTWPVYFRDVITGVKTFEIRRDDGRGFKVGDVLQLNEYSPASAKYTGRSCRVQVSYLTTFEQKPNHVVMAIKLLTQTTNQKEVQR